MVLDDGGYKYVYGLGLAYGVDSLGNTLTQHTDGLGSVRVETDSSGNVVQTYGTDEFGIVDAALTSGTQPTPFQYTGEPRDSETGLVYLRARSYDPTVGRFMQADPLRKSGPGVAGWNRYAYVGNNPIRFTDPTGSMATGVNPEPAPASHGDLTIAQVAAPTPIHWPEGQWCLPTIFGALCLGTPESGVNDADTARIRLNSMSVQLQYSPLGGGGTTTNVASQGIQAIASVGVTSEAVNGLLAYFYFAYVPSSGGLGAARAVTNAVDDVNNWVRGVAFRQLLRTQLLGRHL